MNRRDFLKMASMAGIAVVSPIALTRRAKASHHDHFDGPYYVMLNVIGGWDPTYLCDPKGINDINQGYREGDILSPNGSPIRYAPVGQGPGANKTFFEKYAPELLVLNGIDMATNSHEPGQRCAWTGSLENNHYPSFAALVAATKAPDLPLSYLSYGGYDVTAKLIPTSRISSAERLNNLIHTNHYNADEQHPYHTQSTLTHIQRALQERRAHELEHHHHHLPKVRQAMTTLFTAQLGKSELKRITPHLPDPLPDDNPLKTQAAVALAAFKAGLCVSVNMAAGGFDTHDNHDEQHIPRLSGVLEGMDYIMERAEQLRIRDKIVLVAASDFGRTPNYNDGNGKDHWPISSAMILGHNIRGNRVIGASNDGQENFKINPNTLALETDGITFRPEHIHRALRRHAGIHDHEISKTFDLTGEDLDLFT